MLLKKSCNYITTEASLQNGILFVQAAELNLGTNLFVDTKNVYSVVVLYLLFTNACYNTNNRSLRTVGCLRHVKSNFIVSVSHIVEAGLAGLLGLLQHFEIQQQCVL